MDIQISEPLLHVLIIGAGSAGLLIAQRLKTLGIKCTVFERELYLNQRPRDWNFGIYWSQSPLAECLPEHISKKLRDAFVDPSRLPSADDYLPVLNAQTGETLINVPSKYMMRLRRSKFRMVVGEGIDVQYGKILSNISHDNVNQLVIASFEDGSSSTGSLLIGADGANSRVREHLLGPEKAGLQPLPLMGLRTLETFPTEIVRRIKQKLDRFVVVTYHPEGLCAFISLHEVPDQKRPETWKWMLTLTWNDAGNSNIRGSDAIRSIWDQNSGKLFDPFRSAFLSIPTDAQIYCERLRQWPTEAWDNHNGSVTLAGDAAHPMTYHRGQGLNNAVHDAAYLGRALHTYLLDGKTLEEVISAYEIELVERGRNAVISSGQNSLMVHDWEQLKKSPIFTSGMSPDKE